MMLTLADALNAVIDKSTPDGVAEAAGVDLFRVKLAAKQNDEHGPWMTNSFRVALQAAVRDGALKSPLRGTVPLDLRNAKATGQSINAVRVAQFLSRSDMERETGIIRQTILRIEGGRFSRPSAEYIGKMIAVLGADNFRLVAPATDPKRRKSNQGKLK